MFNPQPIVVKSITGKEKLTNGEKFSVIYHDIFDYPLDFADLVRWKASENSPKLKKLTSIKDSHLFVQGRSGLVYKKQLRKRISAKKMLIARKASVVLSKIPFVKLVGLTGSLSMNNATEDGDIDLLIVTSKDLLWTTRILGHLALVLCGLKIRRSGSFEQKNRLCLNMWISEDNLAWKYKRNYYTSHELAQIVPLYSKGKIFEKMLWDNRWILKYWPNSVKINPPRHAKINQRPNTLWLFVEKLAFKIQYNHMKNKISREVVKSNIALFHPHDWGLFVEARLSS